MDRYAVYYVYNHVLYRYFYPTDTLTELYRDENLICCGAYSNYYIILGIATERYRQYLKEISDLGYSSVREAGRDGYGFYFDDIQNFYRFDVLTGQLTFLEKRHDLYGDPFENIDFIWEGNDVIIEEPTAD